MIGKASAPESSAAPALRRRRGLKPRRPLSTKPPLFLGPELAFRRAMLVFMRPKSQLVLKDAVLSKPSGVSEFLGELKKSDSVSGYHYIPSREPVLVDFPAG